MRIAMVGTGDVGLVSGACFADFGHDVACVDKDGTKIDALNAGRMPICEQWLEGAGFDYCALGGPRRGRAAVVRAVANRGG